MPKVSVVLSVGNQEKYLKDAVQSILNQTFKNFEFIIINDSSKNLEIPKDPRIKIITNVRHLGLTKSLNIGLKIAKGEYIARMDADDISKPQRLASQLKFMQHHQTIAIIGSWVDLIDEKGNFLRTKKFPTSYKNIKNNLIKANQFCHPALLTRKNILDKVGFYDEKYHYSQDYELVLRIASKYPVANIPESLLLYRVNTKGAISYESVKEQAKFALQARIKALRDYGYPKWQFIYLIKPLISFLTPKPLIILIYKLFYFKHEA